MGWAKLAATSAIGMLSSVLLCTSLLGLLQQSVCEQCVVDTTNPCIARCNNTKLDISNLFKYP